MDTDETQIFWTRAKDAKFAKENSSNLRSLHVRRATTISFAARIRQKIKATTFSKRARLKARMKRLRTILTVASGIGCVLLGIVFPISYNIRVSTLDNKSDDWIQTYSIGYKTSFRVGFEDGGLWLYNYEHPWWGGTTSVSDGRGVIYKGGHAHWFKNYDWRFGGNGNYLMSQTLAGERGEFLEKDMDYRLSGIGIYYRCFDAADYPPPYWTLEVSLWYLISLFAILPALWIYKSVRLRVKNHERKA